MPALPCNEDGRYPSGMTGQRTITLYTDYKSPYAFLAKDLAWALERDLPVRVDCRPYILDIPSFLGSARVDNANQVIEASRNAHQWRRVRYSYMDCRRQAGKRGLTIRGPRKIWDSSLAAAGMLFAQRHGDQVFRRYHDRVFERFWKRELDIEDEAVVGGVLAEAGADASAFPAFEQEGLAAVAAISREAEELGVFGVPTFVLDGEIFWGSEHLPDIRAMLAATSAEGQAREIQVRPTLAAWPEGCSPPIPDGSS
jgi:2-hydroxychromene-2-carboxylate isomerase